MRERSLTFDVELVAEIEVLYRQALRLTGSPVHAEDLVSETILRALKYWDRFRPGTRMGAWLSTMLYRHFATRWRRIDLREVDYDEHAVGGGGWAGAGTAVEDDPEGAYYDSFIDEDISRAVHALPASFRDVVVLSDVDGLGHGEIATRLAVPVGTIKSRLFRGRRMLREALASHARERGYRMRASA